MELPRLFLDPTTAPAETRHNWLATQKEALAFGPMDAAAAFLPVLLARLGATSLQVGLLSALPNLAVFLLAIPFGHVLQRRRNAVPWYSRGRLIGQLGLPTIGLALFVVPLDQAVPVILLIVACSTIFGSLANLSFYVVMDGLSGPNGRYELMGRRWGMKGGATAVSLAVIGFVLAQVAFPQSYQLVFLASAAFALLAYRYARTFRIPDHPPAGPSEHRPLIERMRRVGGELAAQRPFLSFISRHAITTIGFSMAVPLIPLFYVRELGASDAWIGLIGTSQAVFTMAGFFLWRGPARRRGGTWVLIPSVIGVAAFPAVLAMTQQELVVAALVGVYAFCLAGIDLALFDELMKAVPTGAAVRFAAFDTGLSNLAALTGALGGAALAGVIGIPGGLVAAAVVGLFGAGLFVAAAFRRRRAAGAILARP